MQAADGQLDYLSEETSLSLSLCTRSFTDDMRLC